MFARAAALAEGLLADPRDVRALHGDLQHYNIRQSPRGWLAFDPKGLVGERTYDCANALCNPGRPELVHDATRLLTHAALLADLLALDRRRVLAFTYAWACLNASFWLPRGGSDVVRWFLKVAEIIEPHLEPLLA
jgi:streptomycin 6-kinase